MSARAGAGATLVPTRDGNTVHLTLLAAKANEGYDLQALYPKADGSYELVGQLRVVSYTPRAVRVKLIPVGQTVSNASQLSTDLSALLKPFGLAVTLDMGAPLDDKSWDLDGNGQLAVDDKGFFNLLSDEQKALCAALRAAPGYDPSTFYLFVLPAQGGLQGDMPRAKQMGYLFGAPTARTVAHELMHGVFKLEHTFSSTYGVAQGSTSNLMDYVQGATLVKHQWDCLYSPGVVIGMFEKEEDGKYIDDNCFDDPANYQTFLPIYESLKTFPEYNKVFDLIDGLTNVSYCFSELKKGEFEQQKKPPLGNTINLSYNVDLYLGLSYRNIMTHEKASFLDYLSSPDKGLFIKPEEWKGMININMENISSVVIFHELNHAAQFVLTKVEGLYYTEALMEVETRMILFYSAFKKANKETRRDHDKMLAFLISTYGKGKVADLWPLTGYFHNENGDRKITYLERDGKLDYSEIYKVIYLYFSNFEKNSADDNNVKQFNLLMLDYAEWIKYRMNYSFNPDEFTPNYYLLNKVK